MFSGLSESTVASCTYRSTCSGRYSVYCTVTAQQLCAMWPSATTWTMYCWWKHVNW